jgi:type III pantothenate kinase
VILLIDIGNSRFKWASWDGQRLQPGGAQPHHGDPATLFYGLALPPAKAVWVSSVLEAAVNGSLAAKMATHFGYTPRFARTEAQRDGLQVAYADPKKLGVDRWLAMLALWSEGRQAFCVAGAGTALTFDAVDDGGMHLGGLIAPGLLTAQKAVLTSTSFAANVQTHYTAGLGRDTDAGVRQGALHACVGLIQRAAHLGSGAQFITGGDASALLPHLGGGWEWRPNLVMEGLLVLARGDKAA